jgi:uroporphyrinogen III methyltransferase/synthase
MNSPTLAGRTILITRAQNQAKEFGDAIIAHGGTPVFFPTIEFQPPLSWVECDRAIDSINAYDALIFTSANGVRFFFQRMKERKTSLNGIRKKSIYAVGASTQREVERHGCAVTAVPETYTGDNLAQLLTKADVAGKRFLFPRGDLSSNTVIDELTRNGAKVDGVTAYQTAKPKAVDIEYVREKLRKGTIHAITFTSPSTVRNFLSFLTKDELTMLRSTPLAVIGPQTQSELEGSGFRADIVARKSTIDDFIETIVEHFGRESS